MKKTWCYVLVAGALALAADAMAQLPEQPAPRNTQQTPGPRTSARHPKTTPAKPASNAAKPAAAAVAIPKDAQQVDANSWRSTDAEGTAWIYRKTPFGINRYRENDDARVAAAAPVKEEPVHVTDLGDSYRFERATPFGAQHWERKKSELNDDEKAFVAKQGQPASAAPSTAAKGN